MDEEVRRSTGQLVRKVEPRTAKLIAEELQAPTRSRRLRAIDVAQAMQMADAVEDELLTLLTDDDHMIRAAAAGALGQCLSEKTRQALREALLDSSVAVQHAAEASIEQLATGRTPKAIAIDLGSVSMPEAGMVLFGP
jgi:HEAT repeat protein